MKRKLVSTFIMLIGTAIMINDIFKIDFKGSAVKTNLNPIKGQINKGDSLIFSLGLFVFIIGLMIFKGSTFKSSHLHNGNKDDDNQGSTKEKTP